MKCTELTILVYYRVNLDTFQPSLKKKSTLLKVLHFRKWNFLAIRLKDFLNFIKKVFSYISENGGF